MSSSAPASEPLRLFESWYARARDSGIDKPNAMALATSDDKGHPDVRMVLLSSWDERGFVFHTNYRSPKGKQLEELPWASLLFWWDPLGVQIRISGSVTKTGADESDAYFAGRPRGSQLGAWASAQSQAIESREALDQALAAQEREFERREVTRPPHWGGYRLYPMSMEFWENRENRLHDRVRYDRLDGGRGWEAVRLAP